MKARRFSRTLGGVAFFAASCVCHSPEPVSPKVAAWQPPDQGVLVSDTGPVTLKFSGISGRYRLWISDPARLARLADALNACTESRGVLLASYDEATRVGRFVLEVDRATLRCLPAQAGEEIDLSALIPLTRALSAFREDLARTTDLRLWNWKLGLVLHETHGRLTLWTGGPAPEDGSLFQPCVDLDGWRVCPEAADAPAGVQIAPVDGRVLRALRERFTERAKPPG